MKLTAVEWLVMDYVNKGIITVEAIEQAKEMEKEQIIDAWKNGDGEFDKASDSLSELYYNETYKSE
jgi:hypothetical protein